MIDLNQYNKLNYIGSGSFGEVFKVTNKQTNESYAAKISHRVIIEESTNLFHNLQREVQIIAKLHHPSILKFIGFSMKNFENENKPVIITEFVPNGSLEDIITLDIESKNDIGWNDTRKLINIYGIAMGLSILHHNKIIHRDLKPDNILMDIFLCPKIADFGYSKVNHTNTESMSYDSSSGFKGTPLYAAPEIWEDCNYTEASDIYAYAMIVYEIMTNERPFKTSTQILGLINKVTKGGRPEFTVPIPEAYRTLIEKCWSQNPSERPTIDQILEQLRNNPGFITEKVEQIDYRSYIDYVEHYRIHENQNEPFIPIHEFISYESKTFNKSFITNDSDEIVYLGEKFDKGKGIKIDKKEAARCYKVAADKGNIDGMFKYGQMLLNGIGVQIDKKKASAYFKKAADKGQVEAMYNYGWMLSQGDGVPADQKESCRYYKLAAEKGHIDSMHNYAVKLLNGIGVEVDKKEASKYFKKAADQGQVRATYSYGWMLKYGDGIEVDKKEASKYFKIAADKGYNEAMKSYARMLYSGDGIPVDKKEANRYFQLALPKRKIKKWYELESLEDFTIVDEIFKKDNIKKGFVNATNQPIIAKFPTNHDINKLKQECDILLKCCHPSIQKVIGLFISKEPDSSALITPYQMNSSLDDILDLIINESMDKTNEKDENQTAFKTIYKVIFGVSNAMKYLEENNMFHGYLKPSNILIGNDYYPILNNIQMKTEYTNEDRENKELTNFLAPEIISGEKASIKSDVFSFGLLVNYLFSGNINENSQNNEATASKSVPSFLVDIVNRCLNNDLNQRPTFSEICNYFENSFRDNKYIQKYKNQIEAEIECPVTFYRIPKVIVKSPRILITDNNNNDFNSIDSDSDDNNFEAQVSFGEKLLELENLQNIFLNVDYNRSVKLVMVCGRYQSGKSTFLRKLTGNGGFYSGKNIETTTMGILIEGPYYAHDFVDRINKKSFKQPLLDDQHKLKNDPAIFFIDSQGIGDEEFQYYSSIMKRYLSFFCTLSDLCINITEMTEPYSFVDEVLKTIRRGQMMKLKCNNVEENQDTNNFNKDITKIMFLVRSVNELNDPINTKSEFDIVQRDFLPTWNSQHRIVSNHYLFNLSKAVPLGNPNTSPTTYNCSVWNSIPPIFELLNNSVDNTKDYFQTIIDNAMDFLFTTFFEKFSKKLKNVEDQVVFIASVASKIIDDLISKFTNKQINRQETIDSIMHMLTIIRNIIIPFIIGQDAPIAFRDYNQYSYDLMKDITAYLCKNIPKFEKNLYSGMIEMLKCNANDVLCGGFASGGAAAITTTAFNVGKQILIQAAERALPALVAGAISGPISAAITAATWVISVGSFFGYFIQKYFSKKKKIERICKKKIQTSIPFLWEKVDESLNKKVEVLTFKNVRNIHKKVKALIIVLESTNSNFMKFVIQSMTGVNCKYEEDLVREQQSILFGPFKPENLMKNISRCFPKLETTITDNIHILYLRGYTRTDMKLIEPVQSRAMFFLSSVKSIDQYPTITNKSINLFYFIKCSNVALLRKQDCINIQNELEESNNNCKYRIKPWPIIMNDHDCFDSIGPQTNKCLRFAFHQLLKQKDAYIQLDI